VIISLASCCLLRLLVIAHKRTNRCTIFHLHVPLLKRISITSASPDTCYHQRTLSSGVLISAPPLTSSSSPLPIGMGLHSTTATVALHVTCHMRIQTTRSRSIPRPFCRFLLDSADILLFCSTPSNSAENSAGIIRQDYLSRLPPSMRPLWGPKGGLMLGGSLGSRPVSSYSSLPTILAPSRVRTVKRPASPAAPLASLAVTQGCGSSSRVRLRVGPFNGFACGPTRPSTLEGRLVSVVPPSQRLQLRLALVVGTHSSPSLVPGPGSRSYWVGGPGSGPLL